MQRFKLWYIKTCSFALKNYFHFKNIFWVLGSLCSVAQSRPALCDPVDCSPPGFSVLGIFQARTLKWVPFPSPRFTAAAAAASLQSCPTLCDPIDGSPAGSHPWDCLVKNTGVGCHFLLQCMKVKSASEVAQSCLTLHDPMDCSLPGSSVHGIFQAKALEWGATVH